MKFAIRVLEISLFALVAGGLIAITLYVVGRMFRWTVDFVRAEYSEQLQWLKTIFPKFPRKRKRKD